MKKLLCIVLAVLLCLPLLVACGNKDNNTADSKPANPGEQNNNNNGTNGDTPQQAADKANIAEAFNAASGSLFEKALSFGRGDAELGEEGGEQGNAGEGGEQGNPGEGEEGELTPAVLAEMLAATIETWLKTGDAEVAFDLTLFTTYNFLFSLKEGVLYGNVNGECAYITVDNGMLTTISGLPYNEDQTDMVDAIFNALEDMLYKANEDSYESIMAMLDGDSNMPSEEEIMAVLGAIAEVMPPLTAADLVTGENGVYLLSSNYIARCIVAGVNACMPMFAGAAAASDEPVTTMPTGTGPVDAQAEMEAQQIEMIAGLIDAFNLKIGFKLTDSTITQYVFGFEYTADSDAAMAAIMSMVGAIGAATDVTTDVTTEAQEGITGVGYEEDYTVGSAGGAADKDSGIPLAIGTKVDLAISVNGGLPTGLDMTVVVPDEVSGTLHMAVAYTAEGYPTSFELTVSAPGYVEASLRMTAAYANNVITSFTMNANLELPNCEIDEEAVVSKNGEFKYARITADVTAEASFALTLANFNPEAQGEGPVNASFSVAFDNVRHTLDGTPVANFDGVELYDKDADMSDPQNGSFTLISRNNGQGTIRFIASTEVEGESSEFSTLDVTVGSAPNFVPLEENPYTELSGVVEQLLALEDVSVHGIYAYAVGDVTYFFEADVTITGRMDQQGNIETERHTDAEFKACVAAGEEAPYTTYTLITVDGEGQLVLTPVPQQNG